MLIGISGTVCAGKTEVARYLTFQGFERIALLEPSLEEKGNLNGNYDVGNDDGDESLQPKNVFSNIGQLVDFVTENYRDNYVLCDVERLDVLEALQKRPFFLHVSIDAPVQRRHSRLKTKNKTEIPLTSFIEMCDLQLYSKPHPLAQIMNQAQIKIINSSLSVKDLYVQLSELKLLDKSRLRPSWDSYFMRLADLAALRSNCMKRRVGCVVVRGNRVIATGYNGTPRNLPNCNEGGCPRCNMGHGSGAELSTCLCLHAEENALLEAGRDRISRSHPDERGVLYCNTCPCLTCSIKIVQSGIKEVVYAQSYSMDESSHRVMSQANIILRQFSPPVEGVFI
ncbi:hypothetical protein PGUG_04986 [Meyerozyma guilliermondii ATCC 6260]|uniref:Deoxycytidylate deaminase n=1 Tax=Meyerozyma guilliermondii (strain ATCC 6260 / CBS 566 / DSM 6381 / JCM 1539 / NBRC 10279 / NRRL Y-324) TaxID=294746 RepID=A5DNY5_PICGU|nr:uncharacterized protein PGUG_04986 [Meyerozyma guilliermondii ATCC 6260]EDK40888.2 hypothetical protein PGUG_04986 [Meyerozyma guilliermondii ATCC 6260]